MFEQLKDLQFTLILEKDNENKSRLYQSQQKVVHWPYQNSWKGLLAAGKQKQPYLIRHVR